MKKIMLSVFVLFLVTSVSVSQETQVKKIKEDAKLKEVKEKKNFFYQGRVKYKPGIKKSNSDGQLKSLGGITLVIREKSTEKIIAKTTSDDSGKFKFNTISMRKGLELGWAFPPLPGEIDEYGCFEKLPPAPAPPLVLMDECDDSVLVVVK